VELVLIPLLTLILGMAKMVELHHEYKDNDKYKPTLELFKTIQSLVGFVLLIHFIYKLSQDFSGFTSNQSAKSFILPILLSLSSLPMMYGMGLLMLYETLFIQLSFRMRDNKRLVRYMNWQVFKVCNIHILRVKNFGKGFNSFGIKDKGDVDYAIKRGLVVLRSKNYLK
jgi:hypothetical protein